jgi:hypothetical protein
MRAALFALVAFAALPAYAQTPAPMSAQAAFASQLAGMLSETIAERDAARAQVAALQKELADAKATKPAEAKSP